MFSLNYKREPDVTEYGKNQKEKGNGVKESDKYIFLNLMFYYFAFNDILHQFIFSKIFLYLLFLNCIMKGSFRLYAETNSNEIHYYVTQFTMRNFLVKLTKFSLKIFKLHK